MSVWQALDTRIRLAARDRRMRVLLDLRFVAVLDVVEGRPRPQELSLERMLLARVLVEIEEALARQSGGRGVIVQGQRARRPQP